MIEKNPETQGRITREQLEEEIFGELKEKGFIKHMGINYGNQKKRGNIRAFLIIGLKNFFKNSLLEIKKGKKTIYTTKRRESLKKEVGPLLGE